MEQHAQKQSWTLVSIESILRTVWLFLYVKKTSGGSLENFESRESE